MQDVLKFLTELSNVRTLFFSKTKVKNKLLNILHSIRAKNTQLLTSVTLELLSRARKPDASEDAVSIIQTTVEFNLGFAHFHGICRPKNFTIAVEKFKEVSVISSAAFNIHQLCFLHTVHLMFCRLLRWEIRRRCLCSLNAIARNWV